MATIKTYVGADGRTLEFAAKDADGNVYDLTGLTVTIKAVLSGTTMIDDVAVTVTSAASGLFEYTPTAAELASVGDYAAQVKIEDGTDTDFLEQFTIQVQAVV